MTVSNRVASGLDRSLLRSIGMRMAGEIDKVKRLILEDYDHMLVAPAGESALNPSLFLGLFSERLDRWHFVVETSNGVSFEVPEMGVFDFSDGLEIVEFILDGVAGEYSEIPAEDYGLYRAITRDKVSAMTFGTPVGDNVLYLAVYDKYVRATEGRLGKRFVKFPFSNNPPMEIFARAEEYVKDNMDKWVDNSIRQAIQDLKRTSAGMR